MVHRASVVIAALVLFLAAPGAAAAKWTMIRSTNFVFVGDAPERQIRLVAERLEQFRQVVAILFPSAANGSPVPTVVVVFADERSLAPYVPQFNGRSIEVGGYFAGGDDLAMIAINGGLRDVSLEVVFHEFAHVMTANSGPPLPLWLNEGLAQVWETFEERDGGRAALVGSPSPAQLQLLRASTLIPLRELRAVDRDSPLYNEGSRRSVFYAQSWALAHYLMLGNEQRARQFHNYLTAVRGGESEALAFDNAFGGDEAALERELFQYVRKFAFPAVRYEFGSNLTVEIGSRGQELEDSEAAGYLGELLARVGRSADARTLLTTTLARQPGAVRARVALARMDVRDGDLDAALAALEAVVEREPDDQLALELLGAALIERLQRLGDAADASLRVRARTVLSRAAAHEQASARVLAMRASLELNDGGDPGVAAGLLERAILLAPAREQYRLMAAQALIRQRQFDRATTILAQLLARGSTPQVRERARELMVAGAHVRVRLEQEQRAATAGSGAPASGLPSSSKPAVDDPAIGSRYVLDLRPLGPGEARVPATFRAVECLTGRIVLVLETNGAQLRLTAPRFESIVFVSYRADAPQSISCGALPAPIQVLATYRAAPEPSPEASGVAVAIELTPAGYIPPPVTR